MVSKMRGRINIRDKAKFAEIFIATISWFINSSPDVSLETRERVFKIIQEIVHHISPLAKKLFKTSTNKNFFFSYAYPFKEGN